MAHAHTRSVCVIQHAAAEPPGLIARSLRSEGWDLRMIRTYRGDAVPERLGSDRGLVVMGGPMSVYDSEQYPFLEAELTLIADALARSRPVLGVCLGSQLLAAALGAAVMPNLRREIGWHRVHFTRAAAKDALWKDHVDDLTAFHWHGDRFDVPAGAISLAWSALTECQAFRWGHSAYGILFHPEVGEKEVARMTREFQAELIATGQHPEDILDEASSHLPTLGRLGTEVFRRWARLLETP